MSQDREISWPQWVVLDTTVISSRYRPALDQRSEDFIRFTRELVNPQELVDRDVEVAGSTASRPDLKKRGFSSLSALGK
jgi:hypothetical protein